MVDGTGVGYNMFFYLRNKRGREIREISGHVRVVAVCYWQGRRNWVVGVSVWLAYIKRAYGSYLEVRKERMARLLVLGMFIYFILIWKVLIGLKV